MLEDRKTVSIRLPQHAYDSLKGCAAETRRSMSRMAEVMIEEYEARLYPVPGTRHVTPNGLIVYRPDENAPIPEGCIKLQG